MDTALIEYRRLLSEFDWFYQFSDDYSAYKAGSAQASEIARLGRLVDADRKIYNSVMPASMRSAA